MYLTKSGSSHSLYKSKLYLLLPMCEVTAV
jgi:hypothetical protein